MSTYIPPTLAETMMVENTGDETELDDAVEIEVQRFLLELEQAPSAVQHAIVTRLLAGLAAKLPSGVPAKAIAMAKINTQGAKTKPKRASKKAKGEEFARLDSQLGLLSDSSDPILAWQHFGGTAESLRQVLRSEPMGSLEAMLRHDRMPAGPKPRGRSREALVDAILQRLAAHFETAL